MRRLAVVGTLIIATTGCALQLTPGVVVADRPGYTDGPAVLPSKAMQLEMGITDDHVDDVLYRSVGEGLLRIGIGHSTELRLFANSLGHRSEPGMESTDGLEDIKVGFKVAVHNTADSYHGIIPRVSFLAATTLATGTANRTAHKSQPEAKIAAAWTTSGPWSVYSNVGFGGVYDGQQWGTRGWFSTALWYMVNSKISLFGEGFLMKRVSGIATSGNFIDGGVTYLISDKLQADFRAGHGIGDATSHEHFFGVGLAWRW